MVAVSKDFWPKSLAHLSVPLVGEGDEYVNLACVSSEPVNGYEGYRQLHTALVPYAALDEVLTSEGGIGWKVECRGPHPSVPKEGGYKGEFWVPGVRDDKYEAIVHTWTHHNETVLVSDSALLACYGLIPRYVRDGTVIWDEPAKPAYDVLRIRPLSHYEFPEGHSGAYVEIKRDYLEDYLSLKGCAAVAVFYEERHSSDDADFEATVASAGFVDCRLPGRQLMLRRLNPDNGSGHTQHSEVWGCKLLLKPEGRPISDQPDPSLDWPDVGLVTPDNMPLMDEAYVSDEVLREYESCEEFTVIPSCGCVAYGSWWSVSHCRRPSRNYLAVEIRKLYEGTLPSIIRHFHRYCVSEAQAKADRARYGDRHVGDRAGDLIDAYLALTESLLSLSSRLSFSHDPEDIGGFDRRKVEYSGWWTFESLKPLGFVIPLKLSRYDFIDRCKGLCKLLENLKPGPMKQLLTQLGLPKDSFAGFGSLKLLATICQLAKVAQDAGDDLVVDRGQAVSHWDKNLVVPEMTPLFALNELRQLDAHTTSGNVKARIKELTEAFGLDIENAREGWGLMLDSVYETVRKSLLGLAELLAT
jgi:hypothetical protein